MQHRKRHIKLRHSLSARLIYYFSILIVVLASTMTLINVSRERDHHVEDLMQQGKYITSVLAASLADYMYFNNISKISDVLEMFVAESAYLIHVRAYDKKGSILADGNREAAGYDTAIEPLGEKIVQSNVITFDWQDDQLLIFYPIRLERQIVGGISLGLPLNMFHTRMRQSITQNLIFLVVALLASSFIVYLISLKITAPIRNLVAAAERIGEGDLSSTIQTNGRDEIGLLTESFGYMTIRLKNTLEKLEKSRERYSLALKGANDGIWDWDLISANVSYSPRWKEIIGFESDSLSANLSEWFDRVHPEDRNTLQRNIDEHLAGNTDFIEVEYRIKHQDDTYRWVLTRGAAQKEYNGLPVRVAGSQTDITSRKAMENKLVKTALYDALTELPKRVLLKERIDHALEIARRNNANNFAVLFLDLDGFKRINDTYGHTAGDLMLIQLSQRLKTCLRTGDTLARLSGDEFVILLENVNDEVMIEKIVKRIMSVVEEEFTIQKKKIYVTVSIGIYLYRGKVISTDEIIQNADVAMYNAKMEGKGRYTFLSEQIRTAYSEKWTLEHELHLALPANHLKIFVQPIIESQTHELSKIECLIRWDHPQRGHITPGRFIPAAEESGFITEITRWEVALILKTLEDWRSRFGESFKLTTSINLSANDFMVPGGIPGMLKDMGYEKAGRLSELCFEVTEGALIHNIDSTSSQLQILRDLGVKVELDDFGTGFSSLNYLSRFPLDGIKIDRSFIRDLLANLQNGKVVKSIIRMSHDLNLHVVAEGVETDAQLKYLQNCGCDYIQGFYICRPMDIESFSGILETGKGFSKLMKQPHWMR